MKMLHVVPAALATLVLASQTVFADDAVTLSRKAKAGESARYKATINANVMGQDVVATQVAKYTIKEVKDGKATIEVASEGMKVNIGGNEQEQPAGPPTTEIRDEFNKLVDFKMDDSGQSLMSPEVTRLMAMVSEALFTTKAVKADESWESALDNPVKEAKTKKFTVKTTYLGTDKVDGKDLWKVKQTATPDTDADGNKLTFDTTCWLDPENGQVVKLEGSVKDLPTNFGPLSWTMKMARVQAEDKAAK